MNVAIRCCGGTAATAVLGYVIVGTALALYQHQPPAPVPASAPVTAFSAERAFQHLERIAREPHPIGSAACVAVREEIVKIVRETGITPEIQRANIHHIPGRAGTIHNVLVRLPGERSVKAGAPQPGAVALMAHYDSVAFGPGASDDGSGVVTLLETLRALKAGPPLENDVIFLFADAEEGRKHGGSGCRGSLAFVEGHPWARDVSVVLNFDARGTGGPSYMYETSEGNGWLIKQLAASGATPIASSCMSAAYRSMPVASDLTRFLDAGYAGLNFAFIKGLPRYHTALDTAGNLDKRSLQQNGNYALGLARRLGNLPLDVVHAPNRVYFNAAGYHLVHYPESWAAPLTLLTLALLALVLTIGKVRGRLSLRRAFVASLGWLAFLAIAALAGAAAGLGGYWMRDIYILYTSGRLTIAVVAAVLLLYSVSLPWLLRRLGLENLVAGASLIWAVLLVAATWALPGATYLFLWPLAGATLGWLLVTVCARDREPLSRGWHVFVCILASVPALLIWPGTLLAIHHCLMVIFSSLITAGFGLLLALLTPLFAVLTRRVRTTLAVTSAAIAAAGLIWAVAWPGFSREQPKMNAVTYGLDSNTGQAYWLSSDTAPDKWTGQFFATGTAREYIVEFIPTATERYLKAPAPNAGLTPPVLEVLRDTVEGDSRTLTLRISSPRQASIAAIYASPKTHVRAGELYGAPLRIPETGLFHLINDILPPEGMELVIEVSASRPAEFLVVDHSYGLPQIAGVPFVARPPDCIPKPNTPDFNQDPLKTDETLVARRYQL